MRATKGVVESSRVPSSLLFVPLSTPQTTGSMIWFSNKEDAQSTVESQWACEKRSNCEGQRPRQEKDSGPAKSISSSPEPELGTTHEIPTTPAPEVEVELEVEVEATLVAVEALLQSQRSARGKESDNARGASTLARPRRSTTGGGS